jgi:tetratricopeptide (TPR) repeat protein
MLTSLQVMTPSRLFPLLLSCLVTNCGIGSVLFGLGSSAAIAQPASKVAKTPKEIAAIARSTTIKIQIKDTVGSGVLIYRQGRRYTLATNRHVVCGNNQRCSKIPKNQRYQLVLPDGQKITTQSAQLLGQDLDLAILQFSSDRNYAIAQTAVAGQLATAAPVYTAGFPLGSNQLAFEQGKTIAVANRRLTADQGGYSIIYNAVTWPGMSGGGVFDQNGKLVAIHGVGDRYIAGTDIGRGADNRIGEKIGFNRGIPVSWLLSELAQQGILLQSTSSSPAVAAQTADEHFIAGFNRYVNPGNNISQGKQQAVQSFTRAVQIDSRYAYGYFMRAYVYHQTAQSSLSLADYDRAIQLQPQEAVFYYNRGRLKGTLKDYPGAVADYDRAIAIRPDFAVAYHNRGFIKNIQLGDIPGALQDYNRAIAINSQDAEFYFNRANLQANNLGSENRALADYDRAIAINPEDFRFYANRGAVKIVLKNFSGALTDMNRTLVLNPLDTLTYSNRAYLKWQYLKDYAGAIADYSQMIRIDPQDADAYYNRARVKSIKPQGKPGAIQDYRQAIRLYRQQQHSRRLQEALDGLRQLGGTE